jgi:hypothetical protein
MNYDGQMKIIAAGYDGGYQAVELIDPPDNVKIGGSLVWNGLCWRIKSIAKRVQPTTPDGVVVRLEMGLAVTVTGRA